MDANLKTASTYVNNLLLARGLLRNGKPVEFTALLGKRKHRSKHDRAEGVDEHAQGKDEDSSQVVVQVINLVHDLILRRDVRKEHLLEDPAAYARGQSNPTSAVLPIIKLIEVTTARPRPPHLTLPHPLRPPLLPNNPNNKSDPPRNAHNRPPTPIIRFNILSPQRKQRPPHSRSISQATARRTSARKDHTSASPAAMRERRSEEGCADTEIEDTSDGHAKRK